MPTLTFNEPLPFADRGIKQGDAYREIKPAKSGRILYFWTENVGVIKFSLSPTEYEEPFHTPLISIDDFEHMYEPVPPPNEPQDE